MCSNMKAQAKDMRTNCSRMDHLKFSSNAPAKSMPAAAAHLGSMSINNRFFPRPLRLPKLPSGCAALARALSLSAEGGWIRLTTRSNLSLKPPAKESFPHNTASVSSTKARSVDKLRTSSSMAQSTHSST
mmetsp:Transcript_23524/g.64853  ORF Transcript_23524/g.64853 Transcript_23524/m.64853 type:complete len:130 (+) Transcript_23524:561-950(+)